MLELCERPTEAQKATSKWQRGQKQMKLQTSSRRSIEKIDSTNHAAVSAAASKLEPADAERGA